MVDHATNINIGTFTILLQLIEHKTKTMTYDVVNPGRVYI